jgi:hypothetical protein
VVTLSKPLWTTVTSSWDTPEVVRTDPASENLRIRSFLSLRGERVGMVLEVVAPDRPHTPFT